MTAKTDLDVLVIGAGFGGLYMGHKLRELGFSFQAVEAGDGVGGTWYWNRYPGARVDVESVEYSFSFSKEVEQEWNWTELMPAQPEIERYLNFVADRLDLRKHIKFETRVTAMTWNDADAAWTVETDKGDKWVARFVVTAVGCLSAPIEPAIEGLHAFKGDTLYTNRFPKNGYDFSGKRVAVVGTGSSGVQTIPVVAETAKHLTVLQRSAAYTRPANNRPLRAGELEELKADYSNIRTAQRNSFGGALRFGAVSVDALMANPPKEKILESTPEQRRQKLAEEGWNAPSAWADVMVDISANRAGTQMYGELIGTVVKNPETAKTLVPHYPMGCKRQIIDTNYFETFNKPHVDLVDVRADPIKRVTPTGIELESGKHMEFDTILYATGFDAMTGALNRIDIRGKDGQRMKDRWIEDGPQTYLGLQVTGFPNLFTITGPLSPSVNSNMVVSIEQHVDWIGDCLSHMRAKGLTRIEATPEAQDAWVDFAIQTGQRNPVANDPSCLSWYKGANVPGKKQVQMTLPTGIVFYREKCNEIAQKGYEGFALA